MELFTPTSQPDSKYRTAFDRDPFASGYLSEELLSVSRLRTIIHSGRIPRNYDEAHTELRKNIGYMVWSVGRMAASCSMKNKSQESTVDIRVSWSKSEKDRFSEVKLPDAWHVFNNSPLKVPGISFGWDMLTQTHLNKLYRRELMLIAPDESSLTIQLLGIESGQKTIGFPEENLARWINSLAHERRLLRQTERFTGDIQTGVTMEEFRKRYLAKFKHPFTPLFPLVHFSFDATIPQEGMRHNLSTHYKGRDVKATFSILSGALFEGYSIYPAMKFNSNDPNMYLISRGNLNVVSNGTRTWNQEDGSADWVEGYIASIYSGIRRAVKTEGRNIQHPLPGSFESGNK